MRHKTLHAAHVFPFNQQVLYDHYALDMNSNFQNELLGASSLRKP